MISYWTNLQERERWMVGIALIVCLVYLLYYLGYSPLVSVVERKQVQLQEKTETLVWLQQVKSQSKQQKPLQERTSTQLMSLFAMQLKTNQLRNDTYQMQQTSNGDIELSFDKVPFNEFIQWLWSIQENYRISIKLLSANKLEEPGMVRLRLVISPTHHTS